MSQTMSLKVIPLWEFCFFIIGGIFSIFSEKCNQTIKHSVNDKITRGRSLTLKLQNIGKMKNGNLAGPFKALDDIGDVMSLRMWCKYNIEYYETCLVCTFILHLAVKVIL